MSYLDRFYLKNKSTSLIREAYKIHREIYFNNIKEKVFK